MSGGSRSQANQSTAVTTKTQYVSKPVTTGDTNAPAAVASPNAKVNSGNTITYADNSTSVDPQVAADAINANTQSVKAQLDAIEATANNTVTNVTGFAKSTVAGAQDNARAVAAASATELNTLTDKILGFAGNQVSGAQTAYANAAQPDVAALTSTVRTVGLMVLAGVALVVIVRKK